ncbi:MAG: DNA mismatch repair endonuclease MutL [Victivallales bacterium]|nr:DNA mismatch repair endonuclease MutL [Victivallales bacterium]
MSIIRVLPENICNKIAAGEVIERPASVVKELVENAIDAGADKIVVAIEDGGMKSIVVTDNGGGMDQDDAMLCIEPHATSKIHTDTDIFNIVTFGFRGEAIPSIAAISRFTLRTRRHESREGMEVLVHGGKAIAAAPKGCAPGTEIIVRDLFFNTPARKKFMRTRGTEEKHIQDTVMLLSLPYPAISFELHMDGRTVFSSPGHDTLSPRLTTYFGKEFAGAMLPVDYSDGEVTVTGYIARHGYTRTSRREQRIFVNGRPVEAPAVFNGIRNGYGSLVEKGRFAPVILFLRMPPAMVDVNVHPAKREVRFHNHRHIEHAVATAVAMVLQQSDAPTLSVDASLPLKALLQGAAVSYYPREEEPEFDFPATTESPSGRNESTADIYHVRVPAPESDSGGDEVYGAVFPATATGETAVAATFEHVGDLRIIGILDRTYILAEAANGLVVIDQHAAHERVLYERLLRASGTDHARQQLLLPLTMELSRPESMFVTNNHDTFLHLGFDLEPLGQNTILVNAIPASLHQNNAGGVIRDLLTDLIEHEAPGRTTDPAVIARAACIAAVKAHDPLTAEEAQSLLHQMAACELPFSCPHGRPTVINISLAELEKRFGRR